MEYTKGEWKDKLSATGERIIYVESDEGIEVICRDIRHQNTPIVKTAPRMYEVLMSTYVKLDKRLADDGSVNYHPLDEEDDELLGEIYTQLCVVLTKVGGKG